MAPVEPLIPVEELPMEPELSVGPVDEEPDAGAVLAVFLLQAPSASAADSATARTATDLSGDAYM